MFETPKAPFRLPILIVCGLSGFLLLAGFYFLALSAFAKSPCGYVVQKEMPSPDGKLKIVFYERDCGAEGGPDPGVAIVAAGQTPNDSSQDPALKKGFSDIRWVGPNAVEVIYNPSNVTDGSKKPTVTNWVLFVRTGKSSKVPILIRYESWR